MKKLNKIFISLGTFIMSLITKVYAIDVSHSQPDYGVRNPGSITINVIGITQVLVTFISLIIGLIVLFNKKITKKAKIITISVLIGLIIIANLIPVIQEFFENMELQSIVK